MVPYDTFATPANTSVDVLCLGQTGRRAVWLERSWDTDEFRLMKMGPGGIAELLAPNRTPPIAPHARHALAFDEAAGRVCLGLHTGELYVLDFVEPV